MQKNVYIHEVLTVTQNKQSQHENIFLYFDGQNNKISDIVTQKSTKDMLDSTINQGLVIYIKGV